MKIKKYRAWYYGYKNKEITLPPKMFYNVVVIKEGDFSYQHSYNKHPEDFSMPMEYTGWKDKNGKEIYENDIIVSKLLQWTGVPICEEYTSLEEFYYAVIEFGAKAKDLEIIGNTFKNPELLVE